VTLRGVNAAVFGRPSQQADVELSHPGCRAHGFSAPSARLHAHRVAAHSQDRGAPAAHNCSSLSRSAPVNRGTTRARRSRAIWVFSPSRTLMKAAGQAVPLTPPVSCLARPAPA
jgi:hypothetical protein